MLSLLRSGLMIIILLGLCNFYNFIPNNIMFFNPNNIIKFLIIRGN
jgi:hypothetical protein